MTEIELLTTVVVHSCEMEDSDQCDLSIMFSNQGVWTSSKLTFLLGAIRRLLFMIVALPVHLLCVISNQNACTHSTAFSQHYINMPIMLTCLCKILLYLLKTLLLETFRAVSLSKCF